MDALRAASEFGDWLRSGPQPVGEALLRLSSLLNDRPDAVSAGSRALDELSETIVDRTIPGLIAGLFGPSGFVGDIENYHAAENSMLDEVLDRRMGMPITLAAVVVEVGSRCGLDLFMIGMPGHVLVGTPTGDTFIDAFGGVSVDRSGVEQRLESIFGRPVDVTDDLLPRIDTVAVVNRVCNNLTRTWANDRAGHIDRLLAVRAAIPGTKAERQMVIELAEARGQLDIAARLREERDPDDPTISKLWARLN